MIVSLIDNRKMFFESMQDVVWPCQVVEKESRTVDPKTRPGQTDWPTQLDTKLSVWIEPNEYKVAFVASCIGNLIAIDGIKKKIQLHLADTCDMKSNFKLFVTNWLLAFSF